MKLNSWILVSDLSHKPLLAVREYDNRYEITHDSTNGKIDKYAAGDFSRMRTMVEKSSHLSLMPSDDPPPRFLRYMLDNGDVAEITEDGLTVALNDILLSEQEKAELLAMINGGQLKIIKEESSPQPMPAISVPHQPDKRQDRPAGSGSEAASQFRSWLSKSRAEDKRASHRSDSAIDGIKSGTLDPAFTRSLAYGLKYGKFRGGSDA